MRWSVVALVAAGAVLAGCLEETAPPAPADVQPDEPGRTARSGRGGEDRDDDGEVERSGDVTLRSYSDQFGVTLTSLTAVVRLGTIQGYNCVHVEGAPFVILNGTATATWTSQSPATDSFDLEVASYYANEVYASASGPSPLVLEFEDIEAEADTDFEDLITFGVQLSGAASLAYEQEVTLALAFEYESDIDVDAYLGYC